MPARMTDVRQGVVLTADADREAVHGPERGARNAVGQVAEFLDRLESQPPRACPAHHVPRTGTPRRTVPDWRGCDATDRRARRPSDQPRPSPSSSKNRVHFVSLTAAPPRCLLGPSASPLDSGATRRSRLHDASGSGSPFSLRLEHADNFAGVNSVVRPRRRCTLWTMVLLHRNGNGISALSGEHAALTAAGRVHRRGAERIRCAAPRSYRIATSVDFDLDRLDVSGWRRSRHASAARRVRGARDRGLPRRSASNECRPRMIRARGSPAALGLSSAIPR